MPHATSSSKPSDAAVKPPSLADDAIKFLANLRDMAFAFGRWCAANPVAASLLVATLAVLVFFLGFEKYFQGHSQSAMVWAWAGWNEENDQEFSKLVPLIFFGLLWFRRKQIAVSEKSPGNLGLVPLIFGILLFVVAVRTLQPRAAILAIPALVFGAIYFLYGRKTARHFLFPCAFLIFMVPMGALVQMTAHLQLFVAKCVMALTHAVGISLQQSGSSFKATDGSFSFDIAEGCSGIHSLMAMAMITAIYVHFTQDRLWKKLLIFAGSLVFAMIGNIGRIFTVVVVAKYINPRFALGTFHDYSDYIIFPFAIAAMLGFSWLINGGWKKKKAASANRHLADTAQVDGTQKTEATLP